MNETAHTDVSKLLGMLQATEKKYDIEKITQAYEYANELHRGQFRASGEPYISHPIAVAEIVAGLELDTDSICAALLHDAVEDCAEKTSLKEIEKKFGAPVAMLVDGLTKIVTLQVEDKEEAHIETLRKMLLAMSRDIRVIFIKLCDRLHNMRTLAAKPDPKRRVTALETMHVYAPLAHRLGMQRIKLELENLSLQFLDPIGYEEVRQHISEKYGENQNFLEKIQVEVGRRMAENDIQFTIEGRIKSVYSIYKKMYNQNKSFDQIYDFYALRIIVDTELECYTALGLIHEKYNSIPGRFKDYDIGDGLEGGQGAQLVNTGSSLHIGQGEVGHGDQGLIVEVDHGQLFLQGQIGKGLELAESRGIDQDADVGALGFQELLILIDLGLDTKIQGDGTDGSAGLGGQRLQAVAAAGNQPQLVKLLLFIQGQDELPPHSRGRTCDDGDLLSCADSGSRFAHSAFLLTFSPSWAYRALPFWRS